MNIDIYWDVQRQEALICSFAHDWTWHECREAMQVVMYMQDGVDMDVRYIYDLTESTLTTRACLNRMKKLLNLPIHPSPEQIIIVDKAYRLNMLQTMLSPIINTMANVTFATDIHEARKLLATPQL